MTENHACFDARELQFIALLGLVLGVLSGALSYAFLGFAGPVGLVVVLVILIFLSRRAAGHEMEQQSEEQEAKLAAALERRTNLEERP